MPILPRHSEDQLSFRLLSVQSGYIPRSFVAWYKHYFISLVLLVPSDLFEQILLHK